jgi:hypothetical protein
MVDTHTRSTPAQSHLVAVVDLCPASTSGHQRGLYYLNRLIDESHTMTIDSSLECELSLKIWDGLSEWAAGVSHSPHESLRSRDVRCARLSATEPGGPEVFDGVVALRRAKRCVLPKW